MMFSREAMTASDTEEATPPKMPSTTSRLWRRGVMIPPPPPLPARAPPASAPPRESGARPRGSTRAPGTQTRSTATRSPRSRPSTRSHCLSRFDRLPHPLGLPLSVEDFPLQAHDQHRPIEQHEPEQHHEQG